MTTQSITSGYPMRFNMKCLFAVITIVLVGCANDTGVSVSADYDDDNTIAKHYFPTDLEYVGIYKKSNVVKMVMKNNTAYKMSVKVNYTISCLLNGKADETTTETLKFYLDMYEQKESLIFYRSGMTSIYCAGTIISIIPDDYDRSNFQAWTGSYPILIK